MKIIFLNCWQAKAGKAFFDFVERESETTDIFCFQEVSPDLYLTLTASMSGHKGLYKSSKILLFDKIKSGQAIFVKKRFKVNASVKIPLYRELRNDIGFMQCISTLVGGKNLWLGNLHGKSRPGHKLDTPARLKQSKIIIDFFKTKKEAKIIGGDFNLLPQTKSIEMFEEGGYVDLIKKFKIPTTRNRLAWNQLKKNEEKQLFADYVFVSPVVKVKNFSVPNLEISDHTPLILDFEI
ncbi:MAG: endonuclease/exonuclease/phosphatase family protein [bacterium]